MLAPPWDVRQALGLVGEHVLLGGARADLEAFPGLKGLDLASRTPFRALIEAKLQLLYRQKRSFDPGDALVIPLRWPEQDMTGVYEGLLKLLGGLKGGDHDQRDDPQGVIGGVLGVIPPFCAL